MESHFPVCWQRASFDAMVVIAALLGLVCAAPALPKFKSQHWVVIVALALGLSTFGYVFKLSLKHAEANFRPFEQIEFFSRN